MFLWPRIYSWNQFTLFNESMGAVGYHWKWHFKVIWNERKAWEDTGHCSWGNKQTAMLNVCYWGTGRAGARDSGTGRLVFVYAGFPSLAVGWEFQLLPSHHASHCNDSSHGFSSISHVFSNVLRIMPELAFNPPPHHIRTEKTDVAATTFPHPCDPQLYFSFKYKTVSF